MKKIFILSIGIILLKIVNMSVFSQEETYSINVDNIDKKKAYTAISKIISPLRKEINDLTKGSVEKPFSFEEKENKIKKLENIQQKVLSLTPLVGVTLLGFTAEQERLLQEIKRTRGALSS